MTPRGDGFFVFYLLIHFFDNFVKLLWIIFFFVKKQFFLCAVKRSRTREGFDVERSELSPEC